MKAKRGARGVFLGILLVVLLAGPARAQTQNCQACHTPHGPSLTNFPNHSNFGCDTCHVPHDALDSDVSVPLWNPGHSVTQLEGHYDSPTLDAQPTSPDGANKLCLSCHDGTQVHSGHRFGDGAGMGGLEVNHPISFVYDTQLAQADWGLVDPTTLPPGILDIAGKVQCTSCHDVHSTVVQQESLLRWPYDPTVAGSTAAFCRTCHLK